MWPRTGTWPRDVPKNWNMAKCMAASNRDANGGGRMGAGETTGPSGPWKPLWATEKVTEEAKTHEETDVYCNGD